MRVALLGLTPGGMGLAQLMECAGHTVEELEDPQQLDGYQALILGVGEQQLERSISAVEPHVHDRLIVIHTCLSRGVQVLDPLETRGCVVIAAAPTGFAPNGAETWLVSTLDELGETIAELILGENQATAVMLADAARPAHAARIYYAAMLLRLSVIAVRETGLDEDPAVPFPHLWGDSADIIAAFRGIEEPGLRRAYRDVARRVGEVFQMHDLELWALQEENR